MMLWEGDGEFWLVHACEKGPVPTLGFTRLSLELATADDGSISEGVSK